MHSHTGLMRSEMAADTLGSVINKQNRRVRTAVLTGFAALAMASTGACNDASPPDVPSNQQNDDQQNDDQQNDQDDRDDQQEDQGDDRDDG